MPTPQSCVEALLIEAGLSLPYAFHSKKSGFLPPTPLPERGVQLFMSDGTVYWNPLCLFKGAGPSPKVRDFCSSWWTDRGKFCGSIACPCSTSLCPYSQKTEEQWNEMLRLRPQPIPCTIIILGMFSESPAVLYWPCFHRFDHQFQGQNGTSCRECTEILTRSIRRWCSREMTKQYHEQTLHGRTKTKPWHTLV